VPALKPLYSYAWFVGFFVSGVLYWGLNWARQPLEAVPDVAAETP